MLTLTLRHHAAHELSPMLRGLSDAWRATIRGRPWRRFRDAHGVEAYCRALEVTHGRNGWHPHLHVLLWLRGGAPEVAGSWLADRWERMVVRELGAEHRPSADHGVRVSRGIAKYVQKMGFKPSPSTIGLEMADPATKRGRGGSASVWELVDAAPRSRRARQRWGHYAAATRGRRQLTWSRRGKDAVGYDEGEPEPWDVVAIVWGPTYDRATLAADAPLDAGAPDLASLSRSLALAPSGDVEGVTVLGPGRESIALLGLERATGSVYDRPHG